MTEEHWRLIEKTPKMSKCSQNAKTPKFTHETQTSVNIPVKNTREGFQNSSATLKAQYISSK